MADASSAEYKGDVRVEELVLNRAEYVGKVVELRAATTGKFLSTTDPAFMYVYDSRSDFTGPEQRLMLSGQQALEWAVKQSKRGFHASCRIYAFVDERELIALGTRQSQADNGYTYGW